MRQQSQVKFTVPTKEQLLIVNRNFEELKPLQVNEHEAWRLLTLAFGSGPIYSLDVAEARRLKNKYTLALSGLTSDQIMQVENAVQPILNEYRNFTEKISKTPSHPISEHHDATFVFKNLVIDERIQKSVHDILKVVKELYDGRKRMKLALEQAILHGQLQWNLISPVSPGKKNEPDVKAGLQKLAIERAKSHTPCQWEWDLISPEKKNKQGVKTWFQKHILWPLRRWGSLSFDGSIVWTVGILIGLLGFIGYMGYLTGEFRPKLPANATGFKIVLPQGYSWKALGKSEWTSERIAGEPYKIVINRLKSNEYDALYETMAQKVKEVTLPAGKALRLVVPRRGSLYLQTGELGICFLIKAGLGGWSIQSFCLTEAEADDLARSFVVDDMTR
jgi:hypothetical protein